MVVDVDVGEAEAGVLLRDDAGRSDAERACRVDDVVGEQPIGAAGREHDRERSHRGAGAERVAELERTEELHVPAGVDGGRVGSCGGPTVDDSGQASGGADLGRHPFVGVGVVGIDDELVVGVALAAHRRGGRR